MCGGISTKKVLRFDSKYDIVLRFDSKHDIFYMKSMNDLLLTDIDKVTANTLMS